MFCLQKKNKQTKALIFNFLLLKTPCPRPAPRGGAQVRRGAGQDRQARPGERGRAADRHQRGPRAPTGHQLGAPGGDAAPRAHPPVSAHPAPAGEQQRPAPVAAATAIHASQVFFPFFEWD